MILLYTIIHTTANVLVLDDTIDTYYTYYFIIHIVYLQMLNHMYVDS